ncbi:MAG: hypothetical protein ACM34L_15730, partial [Gemmatimonas sp.]
AIIHRLLAVRAARPALFVDGSYRPLAAHGPRGEHIFAFVRHLAAVPPRPAQSALVVVPRLTRSFAPHSPPMGDVWRDTALHLPPDLAHTPWRDAITGLEIRASERASTDPALSIRVPISLVFSRAPVAVLLD